MDNQEQIKQFVNGIGALGETAGMLMNSFMKNGFSREEAISLTKEFLISVFLNGSGKKDK